MPTHRDVSSLQSLCVGRVASLLASVAPYIASKIHRDVNEELDSSLQRCIDDLDFLKQLITNVPHYLREKLALEVLRCLKVHIKNMEKRIDKAQFISMHVYASLSELVLGSHLKTINFAEWPIIMRGVLLKNLYKMTGLETLIISPYNLFLGITVEGMQRTKYFQDGFARMRNLKCLCLDNYCTDVIVQTIAENCPYIEHLDFYTSKSVTDRSIPFLLRYKNLHTAIVEDTSVTTFGRAQLIVELPKLEHIGFFHKFQDAIKCIENNYAINSPFGLTKVGTSHITTEHLKLFVDLFPKLQQIELFASYSLDLTVLSSLDNLNALNLLECSFLGDCLDHFLAAKGSNITALRLRNFKTTVNLDDFVISISQYCPKLKSLNVSGKFVKGDNFLSQSLKLKAPTFTGLEKIIWDVWDGKDHFEFILNHALNLCYIETQNRHKNITHSALVHILKVNPLKQLEVLRVLHGHDLNMQTIELLLATCSNIKVLSDLTGWHNITEMELLIFKQYIRYNNFDLELKSWTL